MAFSYKIGHESVQEGEHQGADMSSVNIGIRHYYDLVITEFFNIKVIMDTRSEGCDHGLDLGICIYLVKSCLLNV